MKRNSQTDATHHKTGTRMAGRGETGGKEREEGSITTATEEVKRTDDAGMNPMMGEEETGRAQTCQRTGMTEG